MEHTTLRNQIHQAVAEVPSYADYSSSQELQSYYQDFAERCRNHPQIDVEIDPIGSYTDLEGNKKPLWLNRLQIAGEGKTAFLKGGVHANEVVYRRMNMALCELTYRRPNLVRDLGYNSLIFLDADPVGTDLTTWHKKSSHTPFEYLTGAYRGFEQIDWDYPWPTKTCVTRLLY